MIFATAIIFWAAVDIIFDPGIIEIKLQSAPAVVYDRNDESWAVPTYDKIKKTAIKIKRCVETESVSCLRGK